jgi:hypothetical protein
MSRHAFCPLKARLAFIIIFAALDAGKKPECFRRQTGVVIA